jgi:hypothetical protein
MLTKTSASHGGRVPRRLVQLDCLIQPLAGACVVGGQPRGTPSLLEQPGPRGVVLGELRGPVIRALGVPPEGQGRRSLTRLDERVPRQPADLADVGGVRIRTRGVEQVGRDHVGDLAGLATADLLQIAGGSEVERLAVPPRERPVCDRPQKPLDERELAALS